MNSLFSALQSQPAQDRTPRARRASTARCGAPTPLPLLLAATAAAAATSALEVAGAAATNMVPRAQLDPVTHVGAGELVLKGRDGAEVGLFALGVAGAAATAEEAPWGARGGGRGRGRGRGGAVVGGGGLEGRGHALWGGGGRRAEVVAEAAAAGVGPGRLGDGWVRLGDGVVGHISFVCLVVWLVLCCCILIKWESSSVYSFVSVVDGYIGCDDFISPGLICSCRVSRMRATLL